MANYNDTKMVIDAKIRRNGRQAITGDILNSVLTKMLDELGKGGFKFGGLITPTSTFTPGDANFAYVAAEPGIYANFGGFTLEDGHLGIFTYDGAWHMDSVVISGGGTISGAVRYDRSQLLSDAQKGTARSNIGAISSQQMADAILVEVHRAQEAEERLLGNIQEEMDRAMQAEAGLSNDILAEQTRAEGAESALSQRIDTIIQGRNVRDIVGNYDELLAYDTSTLGDNDIVMVLLDATKSGHTTYYRWKEAEGEWEFIGGLAFTYTKTEIDAKFSALHIVLPSIPDDAVEHPENYQELLAQIDTMVRGAGTDASFKMPVSVVDNLNGNVDVTFVKSNPAHLYLGMFADDRSTLYHITRTISQPRTYTIQIVENVFARTTDLEGKQDALNDAQLSAVNSGITADKVADICQTIYVNIYESEEGLAWTDMSGKEEHNEKVFQAIADGLTHVHLVVGVYDEGAGEYVYSEYEFDGSRGNYSFHQNHNEYVHHITLHSDPRMVDQTTTTLAKKSELTELLVKVGEKAKVTPTLTSGTQIATLTTENAQGQAVTTPLYAPNGGGGIDDAMISMLMRDRVNWKVLMADGTMVVSTTKPSYDNVVAIYAVPDGVNTGYQSFSNKPITKIFSQYWNVTLSTYQFSDSNLEEIDLSHAICLTSEITPGMNYWARGSLKLRKIIFPVANTKVYHISNIFTGCTNLESVDMIGLDCSGTIDASYMFNGCGKLRTLIGSHTMDDVLGGLSVFTGISISFSLYNVYDQTPAIFERPTLRAIINGLADLSESESQTLTLGPIFRAKLTDDDIAIATNKNWVLA